MKKYLTNNILLKILSVLFAIMLWLVVLNIDDPNTTRTINNIEVTIENADAVTGLNKVYNITEGQNASVSVTGPRSIVDKLTSADFVAVADFTELSQTNAVPISIELKRQSYRDKVVINAKTNTMKLSIEDIETKEFTIQVKNTGELGKDYVIYKNTLSDSTVKVSAPSSVMNTIASVVAEVRAEGETTEFSREVELACVGNNGRNIDMQKNNITIDIPSVTVTNTVYYSKTVKLTDLFDEIIPEGYSIISKEYSNNTVTIAGYKKDLEGFDELVIPGELFEIKQNQKEYNITCDLSTVLPDNLYVYGENQSVKVKVVIDRTVRRTYTVDLKKIALVNIPEDYVASIVTKGIFSYTLIGLEEVLDNYQTQEAYNVSLEGLQEGTHKVQVTIDTGDDYRLAEYVYIEVNLKKQGTTDTTGEPETTTTKRETETTTKKEQETTKKNNSSSDETNFGESDAREENME